MEERERVLYEAAVQGSVPSLLRLLQVEGQLLLHRSLSGCMPETPLHIAPMLGHLEFAQAILARLPQMAGAKDTIRNSSPLHLATANGHLELVKELLFANNEMCLETDCQGRNPLHIAVIKGHTEVLKELVRASAAVSNDAETGTILHLCVKHHQLEALEFLVGIMGGDREFINSKDHNGSTILHLAAENGQYEMFEFLRNNAAIDMESRNTAGFLALDMERQAKIFPEQGKEFRDHNYKDHRPGGGRSNDEHEPLYGTAAERWRGSSLSSPSNNSNNNSQSSSSSEKERKQSARIEDSWVERKKQSLMVVARLIATVAFQSGITPPGGLWGDTVNEDSNSPPPMPTLSPTGQLMLPPHKAGWLIMAYNHPALFEAFLVFNTTSLITSLSIILLLVSGIPLRHRVLMWVMMVIIWLAITTMSWTYIIAVRVITPHASWISAGALLADVMVFWMWLMGLLLFGHTIRLILLMVRKLRKLPFHSIPHNIFRFKKL